MARACSAKSRPTQVESSSAFCCAFASASTSSRIFASSPAPMTMDASPDDATCGMGPGRLLPLGATAGAITALPTCSSPPRGQRSEEHTSELQSLMRNSSAVFCLKKKKYNTKKQEENSMSLKYAQEDRVITNRLK